MKKAIHDSVAKFNNLSLPATILLAAIVLGGFYYAAEANKQSSIERQQASEMLNKQLQADQEAAKEAQAAQQKSLCVSEAQASAEDYYSAHCSYDCKPGEYYIATYNNDYNTCLQRNGLE